MLRHLALAVTLLLAVSPLRAQGGSAESVVDSLMAEYDVPGSPGGVVAVYRGGEVIFARGYGLASVEHDVPNTPSTPFHMASVSKQFTMFAVAMLADRGLLSLDDDIRQHVPEVPDFGTPITLRHLATHTSGLRDDFTLFNMGGQLGDDVKRQEDVLRLVSRQRELNFEPGSEYLYSNMGYVLLSEVVSRVTGETFREWMAANVFEPLGMDQTRIQDDYREVVPGVASSYFRDEGVLKRESVNLSLSGSTGVVTTAEDMANWLRNYRTHEVGGPAVARMMVERGVLTTGDTLSYALGLGVSEYRGSRRLSHGGSIGGFRTQFMYFPEIDAGVMTMGNLASFDGGAVSIGAADAFFAADLEPATPSADGDIDEAFELADPTPYLGSYLAETVGAFRISLDDDGLTAALGDDDPVSLRPLSDRLFLLEESGIRLQFELDADGQTDGGTVLGYGFAFTRFVPPTLDAEAMAAFEGRYVSDELEMDYLIRAGDRGLVLYHPRFGDRLLSGIEGDQFSALVLGILDFERDEAGAVTGFRATSVRVRDLLFEKR